MSTNTLLVDEITPLTGSTVGLNGVDISGTAPVLDQVLTATSASAANWQTGTAALNSVNVSLASPPSTGNILYTTSSSTAIWKPVVSDIKTSVRVATTSAGTLASDFENGDTIDGVVLVTGDRILIKDQSTGTENGIYIVETTGAPTRASDFAGGTLQTSSFVWVQEGTVNKTTGFVCSGDALVGTDNLSFDIFANAFNVSAKVNNLEALTAAVSAGISYIKVAPGIYTLPSSSLSLSANTTLEGSGIGITNITNLTTTSNPMITLDSNCILKNLTINAGGDTVSRPAVDMSADNSILESVRITNVNDEHHILLNNVDNCKIQNCIFDTTTSVAPTPATMIRITGTSVGTRFDECLFNGGTLSGQSYIGIESSARAVIISSCTFNGGLGTGITSTSNNTLIIKDCVFEDITQNPLDLETQRSIMKGNTFINNSTTNVYGSSILDANLFVSAPVGVPMINFDLSPGNNGFIMTNNRQLNDALNAILYSNTTNNSRGILSRNSFPDRTTAAQFISIYDYTPGTQTLITSTENQARSVTTSIDGILLVNWGQTVWEVTTVGSGANTLQDENFGFPPFVSNITNVGHPTLIERSAGSQNLIVITREYDGAATVTTTFNSNGDQMILMDTGSFGALVFATNGTV